MNIYADLGNSRCKIRYCGKVSAINYGNEWLSAISYTAEGKKTNIYFSSVNKERTDELMQLDKLPDINVINARDVLDGSDIIDISSVKGTGSDRLFGLLGALKKAIPPFITVDCGTAITINALNKERQFIGGTIMPGIYTQMRSLSEKTSQLYSVELYMPRETAGKRTEDAIRSGIINGSVGAIAEIVNKIAEFEFKTDEYTLFVTGGYSKMLGKHLKKKGYNIVIKGQLVLDGLEYCILNSDQTQDHA